MKKEKILFIILLLSSLFYTTCSDSGGSVSSDTGAAGSLARFMVKGDHLYTLNPHNMTVYDIKDKYNPKRVNGVNSDYQLETIFPYKNYLYLGTQNGMLIFDISDPANPEYVGEHSHIVSCDPVVIADDIAYVTLRSGSACRGGNDELQIIDVRNPEDPVQINKFQLSSPFGLGIAGTRLYVLDKNEGLLVFDISIPYKTKQIGKLVEIIGYDCIPFDNKLFISADDGIHIFDTTTEKLEKIGKLLY